MHLRQSIKASTLWKNAITGHTKIPMGMDYSGLYHTTTEVGKVLDARSVLARRYGRQEKGRRLYSVLARRKKGKEKISQTE